MRLPYLRILLTLVATYVVGGYSWLWYAAHIVQDEHGNAAHYKVEADRMKARSRYKFSFLFPSSFVLFSHNVRFP